MSRTLILSVAFGFLLSVSACEQQEVVTPDTGYVEATDAYVQYFGEPPQGKKGRAYARVAYLPLKADPMKVRAFPVYLFSEGRHLPKILERLISKELLLPNDSDLFKPFPDGLSVIADPPAAGVQRILLSTQQSWNAADQVATGIAMSETALQFPDVDKVELFVNGKPFASIPEGGYTHNPRSIAELKPPTLVLIAAAWEKGEENPSELMVEFDRPIKVNSFKLFGPTGEEVKGEYFTSIFQMAVIVHPEKPELYKAGMELKAVWDVADTLGRTGRGEKTLPLHRYEH